MSFRTPAGFISAFFDPLKNPNAPTSPVATGAASSTRGLFAGGQSNSIQYITIATTGDAANFGSLTSDYNAATSGACQATAAVQSG